MYRARYIHLYFFFLFPQNDVSREKGGDREQELRCPEILAVPRLGMTQERSQFRHLTYMEQKCVADEDTLLVSFNTKIVLVLLVNLNYNVFMEGYWCLIECHGPTRKIILFRHS